MSSLEDLFPEGDYRFHLTLRRADSGQFFQHGDPSGRVLEERAHWLDAEPERYSRLLPEGEPVVEEFARMVAGWNLAGPGLTSPAISAAKPAELLQQLGRTLEPDLLFLSRDPDERFRLRAGALCFPTGWALEEKIGHPMDVIHSPVPGLNAALGGPIQQFLARLKPGAVFLRDNWGIAATDTLNLHPARDIPPPAPPVALERLWLRVEHQALLALPQTRGIVFGIRIALHRLDAVARDPAGPRLARALQTMPAQVSCYKRLDTVRAGIVRLLGM